MKVLAIGAHPDDIEIGCGGTLVHLKAQHNAEIHAFVLTSGENSHAAENISMKKSIQQRTSFDLLGVDEYYKGHYIDCLIHPHLKTVIEHIERLVLRIEPDVIFTHSPIDTHQDHRAVAEATVTACRRHQNILHYRSPSTEQFQPSVFVDITQTFTRKCELVLLYKEEDAQMDLMGFIGSAARFYAYRMGCDLVEGFVPRKVMLYGSNCADTEEHA